MIDSLKSEKWTAFSSDVTRPCQATHRHYHAHYLLISKLHRPFTVIATMFAFNATANAFASAFFALASPEMSPSDVLDWHLHSIDVAGSVQLFYLHPSELFLNHVFVAMVYLLLSVLKPLAAACWELIIFPSAHRQHDLQANNHVDQPPPLAGRLLSYRRPPSTHAAAASSRLTSSFMKQAWPLTTVSLVIKRWVSWPMLSCAGEKNSPVEIEQQLLSHRRGSLRFINWPIVEESLRFINRPIVEESLRFINWPNSDKVFKTSWSHGLGFRVYWSAYCSCVLSTRGGVLSSDVKSRSRADTSPLQLPMNVWTINPPCQWLVHTVFHNVPRPIPIYASQFEISLAVLLSGAIDSCWHVWLLHFVSSF